MPYVRHGEQGLHSLHLTHPYPQETLLLINFGHSVGLDGLLYPEAYAMLVHIEEKQMLQG